MIEEGLGIVVNAKAANINLRLLGAVAFRVHCPRHGRLFELMDRSLSDLDFAGYSRERHAIEEFFERNGYVMDAESPMEAVLTGERLIFLRSDSLIHVDVFLDRLQMNHTIEFQGRLDLDYPTLPLAELVMEKLQIHEVTHKDVKDLAVVFREHDFGDSDSEKIDSMYIARILANDWGFYYTVMTNLAKC